MRGMVSGAEVPMSADTREILNIKELSEYLYIWLRQRPE
jgi:hypothetical protein